MPNLAVESLNLSHFRSHHVVQIACDPRPVAIYGANGAGKTNILEAISLLSPGRGVRRSSAEEMTRRPEALGWKVSAVLRTQDRLHEIETWSQNGAARQLRIDGTFPDYTRVIPSGNTRKLEVDAAEFAKAVDRVATVSSERSRAVKLALDEDRLILSVNAPDSGAAEEELAVAYGDEKLEIGFNAKYLLEIASQVDRENAVFLFNTSGDPTLMREGNDTSAIYVVMPMRV